MKLDSVRRRIEAREDALSPFAARAAGSAGRSRHETPCPLRTEFQRDRDRIIHTKSFRRLKHKSQVFIAPLGDHFATRLTHTIEVAQVARTIARALNLNEDLAEAIALGHDLGHTPFGHIGERVLDELLPGGFHHSRHSVRIVERLEKDGRGLNLTREVVEGIRRHSKPPGRFLDDDAVKGMTLEAQVVRLSDALAYLTHDIEDAIRAGVLEPGDLPRQAVEALGDRHSRRVNTLVTDIVENSWACTGEGGSESDPPLVRMSAELGEVATELRDFMFERVYLPQGATPEGRAAQEIVALLFEHYCRHPEKASEDFQKPGVPRARIAADMVCGMTDQYALRTAEEIRPGIAGGVFEGRI